MSRTFTFTAGLPGSGKSSALRSLEHLSGAVVLDSDSVKASHPDFDGIRERADPDEMTALHEWSRIIHDRACLVAANETDPSGPSYIIDGTGCDGAEVLTLGRVAYEAGYRVEVVYVEVSVETSIRRNRQRYERGGRLVPEHIIHAKAEQIGRAISEMQYSTRGFDYIDRVHTIDNDQDRPKGAIA